jgi:hypothetical protein
LSRLRLDIIVRETREATNWPPPPPWPSSPLSDVLGAIDVDVDERRLLRLRGATAAKKAAGMMGAASW